MHHPVYKQFIIYVCILQKLTFAIGLSLRMIGYNLVRPYCVA